MKINAILLLSAVAAIALATPVPSTQRSLYRRDRFRRTDASGPIGISSPVDVKLRKRQLDGVGVNGQPPLAAVNGVADKALKPQSAPASASVAGLRVRQLPETDELTKPATDLLGGLTGGDAVAPKLTSRQLPEADQLTKPATDLLAGLTGAVPKVTPDAGATTGKLAARDVAGADETVGPIVTAAHDLIGKLVPEGTLPANPADAAGTAGGLTTRDLPDLISADTTGPLVTMVQDTVGKALGSVPAGQLSDAGAATESVHDVTDGAGGLTDGLTA